MVEPLSELRNIVQKPDYKKKGNWMARNITRDMALPVSWVLLHTPITANQVTFLSLLTALAGCYMFSTGSVYLFLLGAVLLQVWYLLDHVDGHIARYRGQSGLTGMYLDFLTHYIVHMGIFWGIGAGAYRVTGEILYLHAGIFAGVAMVFFNLIYDVMYKAYFARIERAARINVTKPDMRTGAGPLRGGPLKNIFSLMHKTCEVHVLMNIVTVAAVVSLFPVPYMWGCVILYYLFATSAISVIKNIYIVISKVPDKDFYGRFEIIDED